MLGEVPCVDGTPERRTEWPFRNSCVEGGPKEGMVPAADAYDRGIGIDALQLHAFADGCFT